MKDINLLIEAARNISNDKIIDAVSFAIRANTVCNHLVGFAFVIAIIYAIYKVCKIFTTIPE